MVKSRDPLEPDHQVRIRRRGGGSLMSCSLAVPPTGKLVSCSPLLPAWTDPAHVYFNVLIIRIVCFRACFAHSLACTSLLGCDSYILLRPVSLRPRPSACSPGDTHAPMAWDSLWSLVCNMLSGLAGGNEDGRDRRNDDRPMQLLRETPDETP